MRNTHHKYSPSKVRNSLFWFPGILSFLFLPLLVTAGEPVSEFNKANGFYQKQNYDSAASVYEQLISQDYKSAEVYFNLANSYYKLDHIAKSILNYERALKYNTDDEDILFNLKVAQLKVVDKIDALPEIFYIRWMKSLSATFTTDGWSRIVIISIFLLFLFASIYVLSSRPAMKRTGFILAALFFIVSVATGCIANDNYRNRVIKKNAIVMSISAYVKSSPGESNTDLFLLHEGTKVEILDEFENWMKIRLANGSIGWLRDTDIELI